MILLVEDIPMNQRVATGILRNYGCTVDIADNGEEGVKRCMEKFYDLIFMDAHMPLMDGFEATKVIREYEKLAIHSSTPTAHIPIVAMTALAMEGDRERCLKAGMDDYIAKPIRSKAILQILQKFFSHQPSKENLPANNQETMPTDGDEPLPVFNPGHLLDISDKSEEMILQLTDGFIKDAPAYLTELKKAISSENQETIYLKAHRLNGLVANIRGERFLQVGKKLENDARNGTYDFDLINLKQLETELKILKQVMTETDWRELCS